MYISLFPSSWALFNFFKTFSSSSLSVIQSSSSYSSSSSEYSLPGSSKSGIYVKGTVSMISSKPKVWHFLLTTVTLTALVEKKTPKITKLPLLILLQKWLAHLLLQKHCRKCQNQHVSSWKDGVIFHITDMIMVSVLPLWVGHVPLLKGESQITITD